MYCPNCSSSNTDSFTALNPDSTVRLRCSNCLKQYKVQQCIPITLSELIEDVKSGKPIQAIKKVREELGLGLKDSKDIVDSLRKLYAPIPDNTPYKPEY